MVFIILLIVSDIHSLMMNAEVNLTVIKQIVGHKRIMAIAESGSSHFTNIELIKHVDKIVK